MIDLTKTEGVQTEKGVWAIRLVLNGALFAALPEEILADSLLTCLDRFLSIEDLKPLWMRNPQTNKWSRFDGKRFKKQCAWVSDNSDNPFQFVVSDGKTWADAAEHFCAVIKVPEALRGRGTRSYLRFSLPKAMAYAAPESVIAFVLDIANTLSAESGWSGLGLAMSPDESIAASFLEEEFATAQRFEGIDVGPVAYTSNVVKTGIKGVNWLTLLGQKWVNELGGYELLLAQLSDVASVDSFDHGIVIRAGDNPVLGDRNRGETAHLYRSAGKILAPIRVQRHGRFHKLRGPNYFGEAETLEWLERFD